MGSETGLSDAIARELNAYSQLGYINSSERERRPAKNSKRRMDLFGKDRHGHERVIELKHFCGTVRSRNSTITSTHAGRPGAGVLAT